MSVKHSDGDRAPALSDSAYEDFYASAAMARHYLDLAMGFAEAHDVIGIKYAMHHVGPNIRFIAGSLKEIEAQFAKAREAA